MTDRDNDKDPSNYDVFLRFAAEMGKHTDKQNEAPELAEAVAFAAKSSDHFAGLLTVASFMVALNPDVMAEIAHQARKVAPAAQAFAAVIKMRRELAIEDVA